ncbi:GNAT family N-acetyltransferase [Pandoraea cepalis]|uniref:GNAT family N-acetyltransferase n=1 Tax=Pandoraea cepalis TaxID=2508294 RepID=A0AAW7MIV7_9BURK|nr:GNAT family N-acetyltransferase [Pandoraea cepalis]MDN4572694.1 GNAT family N-acetyltransferase [Pandoraea cepalis]MDN4576792.1 GNAT family N-acetyltransferase [Pandoraea cepalis]
MNDLASAHLDRPIWAALTSRQAAFCLGDDRLARRYQADVAPFAALAREAPDAYRALQRQLGPRDQVALLSDAALTPIASLEAEQVGVIHQMIAVHDPTSQCDTTDVIRLGGADVNEMLDLAQRTKPGPFVQRTHELGRYIGIRDQGRLVAMAGERMHFEDHVEISAVCVDPAWRGRGLAAKLVRGLTHDIRQRGETPFLHVLCQNQTAINVYEQLGFRLRRTFVFSLIRHATQ